MIRMPICCFHPLPSLPFHLPFCITLILFTIAFQFFSLFDSPSIIVITSLLVLSPLPTTPLRPPVTLPAPSGRGINRPLLKGYHLFAKPDM